MADRPERMGLAIERVIRALRTYCPFNRRQTAEDLVEALQSEVGELRLAVHSGSVADVRDELGDVLFNLMSIAALYEEQGDFCAADVDRHVAEKMTRRHPYVFDGEPVPSEPEARRSWAITKSQEKVNRSERRSGLMVLGQAAEVVPGMIEPESLADVTTSLADVLGPGGGLPSEPCVVHRALGPGCVVVVCGLPDRRLMSVMAFTRCHLEPTEFRDLVQPIFDGATIQIAVREIADER